MGLWDDIKNAINPPGRDGILDAWKVFTPGFWKDASDIDKANAARPPYVGEPGSPWEGPPAPKYGVGDAIKDAAKDFIPPGVPTPSMPGVPLPGVSGIDMNQLVKVGLGMLLLLFIKRLLD